MYNYGDSSQHTKTIDEIGSNEDKVVLSDGKDVRHNGDNEAENSVENSVENSDVGQDRRTNVLGLEQRSRTPDIERIANFFKNKTSPLKRRQLEKGNKSTSQSHHTISIDEDNISHGSSPIKSNELSELSNNDKIEKWKDRVSNSDEDEMMQKLNYSDRDTPPSKRKTTDASQKFQLTSQNLKQRLISSQSYKPASIGIFVEENGIILNDDEVNDEESNEKFSSSSKAILSDSKNGQAKVKYDTRFNEEHSNVMDSSVVNDTTDPIISNKWMIRYDQTNQHSADNSAQSINIVNTQLIKSMETQVISDSQQEISLMENRPTDKLAINNVDNSHESIIPLSLQEKSTQVDMNPKTEHTGNVPPITQRSNNFDHTNLDSLETPGHTKNHASEFILEVPETELPIKKEDLSKYNAASSTPTPKNPKMFDSYLDLENTRSTDDNNERIMLQISNLEKVSSQKLQMSNGLDTNNDAVVLSEPELTQDLPEIDDNAEYLTSFDKHNVTTQKDKLLENDTSPLISKRKIPVGMKAENDDSGAVQMGEERNFKLQKTSSFQAAENFTSNGDDQSNRIVPEATHETDLRFPTEILTSDKENLEISDVVFKSAVFCLYSMNYNFYPGILDERNSDVSCWVIFETSRELTDNSDIFYLDIRIGDQVIWKGNRHTIVALECRSNDKETIRCVRGYDTVHIKKKTAAGKLLKKTFIVPMSSISIDLDDWTKRTKLKTTRQPFVAFNDNGQISFDEGDQYFMRSSPSRAVIQKNINLQERSPTRRATTNISNTALDFHFQQEVQKHSRIFESCLFILTNVSSKKLELIKLIKLQGGTILEAGFSDMFNFTALTNDTHDYFTTISLDLKLKIEFESKGLTFACLLTDKYSRSPKYLEALTLKWPTLHTDFVKSCIKKKKFEYDDIFKFLLPSGESTRLSSEGSNHKGVIKSANICQFYYKLKQNALLFEQLEASQHLLAGYLAVIYGTSELDGFVKFTLACFGVKLLCHLEDTSGQFIDDIDNFLEEFNINEHKNVLFYINETNQRTSQEVGELKSSLKSSLPENLNIQVGVKEWLIQSIINESTGFDL